MWTTCPPAPPHGDFHIPAIPSHVYTPLLIWWLCSGHMWTIGPVASSRGDPCISTTFYNVFTPLITVSVSSIILHLSYISIYLDFVTPVTFTCTKECKSEMLATACNIIYLILISLIFTIVSCNVHIMPLRALL